MKQFLLKIIIVGLTVSFLLFLIELFVRSIPNEHSYKFHYLEDNIERIQVLVLGSSVGRSGINPDYIEKKYVFNASNVSQDLETDCAIVDKYIERATNMETVIFSLLPISYTYKMKEGIESWLLRRYHIYFDLDVDYPKLNESLEITNMEGCVGRIIELFEGKSTVDCYENGMGKDSIVESETSKLKQGVKFAQIHNRLYNKANYTSILLRLNKTIQACQIKNVKVILLLMPTYRPYYENINPAIIKECDSISHELERNYNNVIYLNLLKDNDFITSDFRDSDHLSQKGAIKLSKYLNKNCNNDR